MKRRMLRVSAAHFVAGAVWLRTGNGWECERAAPIIRWMTGMNAQQASKRLSEAGFSWEWLNSMEAVEFSRDAREFFAWLTQNSGGYVLNRDRLENTQRPMVLHRSRCMLFRTHHDNPDAFTGRKAIKVCAPGVEALDEYARQHGRSLTRCRVCNP
jgi:hypothetical protein